MVHNGNLTNAKQLRRELADTDHRHTNTESDSEVLLNVLAHEIGRASSGAPLQSEEIFKAVRAVHKRIKGSYAVIALIAGYGLLAFRDPFGIRPLAWAAAMMAPSCWPASPWRWKVRPSVRATSLPAKRSCAQRRPHREPAMR
jgi:glutamine phosphoribosylpyrophosphate amidotransferase